MRTLTISDSINLKRLKKQYEKEKKEFVNRIKELESIIKKNKTASKIINASYLEKLEKEKKDILIEKVIKLQQLKFTSVGYYL